MLALCLATLLSAAPPALDAWAARACPVSKKEPGSNVEMKFMEQKRAECLREAMDKALERVWTPVKKTRPAAFTQWLALQEEYERWTRDTCAALEESNWLDVSTGERSMGTGYGFTESQCLQRQRAWRGFYAEAWARGEYLSPARVFPGLESSARGVREAWRAHLAQARRAMERAPAQEADPALPARKLTRNDWKPSVERLERVLAGPDALAARQCALAAAPPADCAQRFAESLFVQTEAPQSPIAAP